MKVVIIGAGQVGFHVASHLALENKDVVVVDTDPEAIRSVADRIDVQTVQGSGSSPATLEEAGIRGAEILLAVTDSDEVNLAACLMTDILSPVTKKLARLRNADFDAYHTHFRESAPKIDTVINPEIEVVNTIEQLMDLPGAVDVGAFADGLVQFVGIQLDETARLAGARLSEISTLIGGPGPLIAAVVRGGQLIIPSGQDKLLAGDEVYFTCERDKVLDTLAVFDKEFIPVKRVMIVGGGSIGLRLAKRLEEKPISIKIVERDPERCAVLAERLNKAVVFHGDGSDQDLLVQENIQDMDFVVMLTGNEETNIIGSLLAKRMGARKAVTKISRFSYFQLTTAIGIEKVVSPRLSAINGILRHIRRGKVISAVSIKGEQAEVIEAEAMETSDIVGRPLKDIRFPEGVLVVGIIHSDRVMIPTGASVIAPGDRVILFAKRGAIPKLEKILAVKLEFF